MKRKQLIYLFIALLLPGCIFMFLKFFGKNEFAVHPLYQTETPAANGHCPPVSLPYRIPDSVYHAVNKGSDSLTAVIFGGLSSEGNVQWQRVLETFPSEPLNQIIIPGNDARYASWRSCIFFIKEPFNLVLVDNQKRIRGEYDINDREDVDRLLTEITIILRKY